MAISNSGKSTKTGRKAQKSFQKPEYEFLRKNLECHKKPVKTALEVKKPGELRESEKAKTEQK